jgi:4-oxalocrotonate tautomerase
MEEPHMPLVQVKLIEEAFTTTEKKEIVTELTDAVVSIKEQNGPSWAWVDIEDVLSDEWEVGGLAMTTDAIRALVAGEQETSEGI